MRKGVESITKISVEVDEYKNQFALDIHYSITAFSLSLYCLSSSSMLLGMFLRGNKIKLIRLNSILNAVFMGISASAVKKLY